MIEGPAVEDECPTLAPARAPAPAPVLVAQEQSQWQEIMPLQLFQMPAGSLWHNLQQTTV